MFHFWYAAGYKIFDNHQSVSITCRGKQSGRFDGRRYCCRLILQYQASLVPFFVIDYLDVIVRAHIPGRLNTGWQCES